MDGPDWAEYRIEGPETETQSISGEVLERVLAGLRQFALLLGSMTDGQDLRQRFRPSTQLRRRHALRVSVPQPGSFVIPFAVVDETPQPRLPETATQPGIATRMVETIAATATGDEARLRELVTDSRYRDRILQTISDLGPQPGERWWATCRANGQTAVLRDTTRRHARQWLAPRPDDPAAMTVTGELVRVQFDENRLSIKYLPTGRLIDCSYLIEVEDQILESRRDLVQVTGEFQLGQDGHPEKLVNVSRIEPVDLSPLELSEVEYGGTRLTARQPLVLTPKLDESQQLYAITDHTLDLQVFAETREQLLDELAEHLVFTWRHYAMTDAESLTSSAQDLGSLYRDRFRKAVGDAT